VALASERALRKKKNSFVTAKGPTLQAAESNPLPFNPLKNKIRREKGKKEEWKNM
jgi:hypothetical protein